MPGPVQQVLAEQLLDVGQDARIAGGVQSVAPVIDGQPGQVKAGREAAYALAALQDRGCRPLLSG